MCIRDSPTPVQGKGVAESIAKAIRTASARNEVDTLIICRGGGSMEDLWQFNEEIVARAVAECAIPTISGIGHETDFSICDFVADARAATPTAAAELASVDLQALQAYITQLWHRLERRINTGLQANSQKLDFLARRLISPQQRITLQKTQIDALGRRMDTGLQSILKTHQQYLLNLQNSLNQLNPQNVLARGYALARLPDGTIIRDSQQTRIGELIEITLHRGSLTTNIQTKKP